MMTPNQRQAAFNELFEQLPGRNIERIRQVCAILFCKENTVRGWRLKKPARYITEAKLAILKRELSR